MIVMLRRRRIFKGLCIAIYCVFSLCAVSCGKETTGNLEREHLFSIKYGNFEDQLDLFQLASPYIRPDSQLAMDDGIFYLSNSSAGKIMRLTSFGDLLALYYNPEKNPQPTFVDADQTDKITTRMAVPYPLNHPTYLAVTPSKHLFAVDTVNEERIEYDQTENLALRDTVIHFNEAGEFVDTVGQEGAGGTPFPPIEGLYADSNGGLIVVCRTATGIRVYWYDNTGSLLYKIPIAFSGLPSPYTNEVKGFSSLDKAVPDFTAKKLYIKVDYYREDIDAETNVSAGISYDKSCLYTFNIEEQRYERTIDIVPYEDTEDTSTGVRHVKKVYGLLGVTANNWCFLTTPRSDGYMLELIDLHSNKIYTRVLSVSAEELVYNAFNLSSDGILSALLAGDTQAEIVWWKTNEIIGASKNE
ncbi:hypothetical protein E4N70_06620 [Treponema vincentii]|uniref:LIC_12708 family protein n=1 Tax=Treponema vincentii TaxID=69710 RepID=UPI0020A4DBAA|nr:hypothetical protein [Treponema vincentii]UTC59131.1 hypothetical protein E4N70_06620 [Treponema vincentii]